MYRAVSSVFICTSEWITGVVTGSRTVTERERNTLPNTLFPISSICRGRETDREREREREKEIGRDIER